MKITGKVKFFHLEEKDIPGSGKWRTKHLIVETFPHYDDYSNTVTYGSFHIEYTKKAADKFLMEAEEVGTLVTAYFDPVARPYMPDGKFKGIYTHNRGYFVGLATQEETFAYHRDLSAAESQVHADSPEGKLERIKNHEAAMAQHVDTTQPQAADAAFQPVNNETAKDDLPF